jgi:acyl-CoA dehydrogenase
MMDNIPALIPEPPSISYWDASLALRELCRRKLLQKTNAAAEHSFVAMGRRAAQEVAPLEQVADREPPRLITHDPRGSRVSRVEYHPAYRRMEEIAYGSGMISINYDGCDGDRNCARTIGFVLGYLFAMAECGLYCPVCMTDGVARVLTRCGSAEQAARVVPHLAATDRAHLWTGGMFVTERAGGSDVGANRTAARRSSEGKWFLNGHKWFCSKVDAGAILVTARPEGASAGTRGLRTFLLLRRGNAGVTIERLKEKLGVRSMPTGEVTRVGAAAEEVGGFEAMVEMLNLSRLYNAVGAVAVVGRALHEARWYAERRHASGRPVLEWPLAEQTMLDLEAEHIAVMLLVFEAVDAMQVADSGNHDAAKLLRILTPMAKQVTGKLAVPCVSEAMELIGGNGYIEETPMPRLLRDAQVLPIWEGTTNILVLDTIRAARRDAAHKPIIERVRRHFPREAGALLSDFGSLDDRAARGWADRLARLFELALLIDAGYAPQAERLRHRPLGLIPGARPLL